MKRMFKTIFQRTLQSIALLAVLHSNLDARAEDTTRRALLIGINNYAAPDLPDLRGAVNDIVMMRHVLTTRYGFEPGNIKTLVDEQATRDAILSALGELVADAGSKDVVYIHYSGHGSQVKDFDSDEGDEAGMDETIVPHDGRTGDIPDITDDELGDLLARFKTREVVVVLDSCHSGTGTRSSRVIPRSIPNDSRLDLYRREPTIRTRGEVALDMAAHILLTGAPANQNALDGPIEGDYRGFFSYALAKVLGELGPGASPSQIHEGVNGVYQQIQAELGFVLPDPQFEASREDLVSAIFPSLVSQPPALAASKPFLEVEPLGPGRVRLVGAASVGAQLESYWAIYPPGERTFSQGGGLATARLIGFEDEHAVAVLVDNASATIPGSSRAIRIFASPPSRHVTVELRVGPEIASQLRTTISDHSGEIQFVGSNEFARFIVVMEKECQGCGTNVVVNGADGLQELDRFPWTGAADAARRLIPLFQRSLDASAIRRLTNPASRIRLDVSVVTLGTRGVTVVPSSQTSRYRIRRSGEPRSHENSLMLELRASCDCYLTVVDLDPEGRIGMLFPNEFSDRAGFHRNGFVRAGETVRIPDSLQAPNSAGFFWDYSPPAGVDTVQVFASTDLETADRIRQHIARVGAEVGTRGVDSLVELRTEFAILSRGISTISANSAAEQAPDWTSVSVNIRVDP